MAGGASFRRPHHLAECRERGRSAIRWSSGWRVGWVALIAPALVRGRGRASGPFGWVGSLGGPDGSARRSCRRCLHGRPWLWPVILAFVPPLFVLGRPASDRRGRRHPDRSRRLRPRLDGARGLRDRPARLEFRRRLRRLFGPVEPQPGMGYGALVVGDRPAPPVRDRPRPPRRHARRRLRRRPRSALIVATIGLFVFFPVAKVLAAAGFDADGGISAHAPSPRASPPPTSGPSPASPAGGSCGVFWNSLALAVVCRRADHAARARLRAARASHRLPRQAAAQPPDRAAGHHAALRHRPRHHPPLRAQRRRDRRVRRLVRHPPGPLDLRLRRPRARAGARLHADRLSGACPASCRASARRWRRRRRRCAPTAGARSAP